MTDDEPGGVSLEEALADKSSLGTYQDEPVLKTTIKLTKAGDGLSKSLGIEPALLPVGSKGMLLVGYEVVQHGHKRIKDVEAFELIQTLEATTVTVVDDKASERKIERQRRKLEEAANRARNVVPLRDAGTGFDPDNDLGDEPDPDAEPEGEAGE